MHSRQNKAAWTVALAFALAASAPNAGAQQVAAAETNVELEKIEVTGTYIKRSDVEPAENVQIITAQDIKQSGQETVADFLRNINSVFGNSINESFSNSFAPGAAMIGLRGLSQKDTLVLLNGRRITNYGLFQNLSDSFVDLNVIPVAAIERIEILKSGGSAIYGSDAIAGVVNIILKQNSTEKTAEVGGRITTEGGAATRDASLLLGFGDFAKDNYNVTATASVYKRDQLLFSQRANTAGQNYTNLPDGILFWHLANQYVLPSGATAIFPNCGTNGLPGATAVGNYGLGCYYNDAHDLSLLPGAERANLTGTGNLRLNSTWTAFADVFFSNEKTISYFTPATLDSSAFVYNPATGGVTPISNILPGTNPASLGGAPTTIDYNFQSVGDRDYEVISNTYRVSVGAKGSWQGWDLDAAYGHSENHVAFTQQNGINGPNLATDIANGSYSFLDPESTPAANAGLRLQYGFGSVAKLDTVDAKGTGPIFQLPGGAASLAIGAEFRHETVDDEPGTAISSGLVLNEGVTRIVAGRSIEAVFAELDMPLTKTVEADIAAREEHYTDVGSRFNPQVWMRWQPVREFTMRVVGADGFRAPSLAEASTSINVAHQLAFDPADPLHRPQESVGYIESGNPKVKPETSRNLDVGVVLSPVNNVDLSLDWYRIYLYNVIAPNATAQQILSDPAAYPGELVRAANGTAVYVTALFTNQFEVLTSGLDINGGIGFPLADGAKLKFVADATYVSTFMVESAGVWSEYAASNGWDYLSPISGGGPVPHWRASLSGQWDNPNWSGKVAMRYVDGYQNSLTPLGITTQQEVSSFTAFDLYGQYRGLKNWKFSMSVVNLFNRQPPYDSAALLFFPSGQPYDPVTYDDLGRMIDLHVAYSF